MDSSSFEQTTVVDVAAVVVAVVAVVDDDDDVGIAISTNLVLDGRRNQYESCCCCPSNSGTYVRTYSPTEDSLGKNWLSKDSRGTGTTTVIYCFDYFFRDAGIEEHE